MTPAGYLTLAVLLVATVAFASGRWRPDAVAVLTLLALLLGEVISPEEGFAGFGSPVLVAVACVLVVSAALDRTGVAAIVGRRILRAAGANELRLVITFGTVAGLLAGVMNSIGAIAVLLPAAMAAAREARISPSKLLLPLALGTRLGGNLTLISGPSNLIASDALVHGGGRPLGLFEFLPLGLAFLIGGMAFIAYVGRRWLPDVPIHELPRSGRLMELYRLKERLFEVRIPEDSPLVGRTIGESNLGRAHGLTVLRITRAGRQILAPTREEVLFDGDLLTVQGLMEALTKDGALQTIGLGPATEVTAPLLESADVRVVEVILAPRSTFAGKTLREIGFREKYGMTVVAIWREGQPRRTGLVDLPVRLGDALLVQGHRERIRLLKRDPEFLVLEPETEEIPRADRAAWALAAVVLMIAAITADVLPVAVATLLAAGIVVAGGCLTLEEVYRSIDWRALVMIGAMLPVGDALGATGAAGVVVTGTLEFIGRTPLAAMSALLLAAIAINQLMPSIAATALLAPIALQAAQATGGNPVAFVMAVIAGTGTTFTPISNPVNLLVMGPGGYKVSDYVRIGLPLALVLGAIAVLVIITFWPL